MDILIGWLPVSDAYSYRDCMEGDAWRPGEDAYCYSRLSPSMLRSRARAVLSALDYLMCGKMSRALDGEETIFFSTIVGVLSSLSSSF